MAGKRVPYSRTLSLLVLVILGLASVSLMSGARGGANDVYLPIISNLLLPIIPDTTNVLSEITTQHLTSVSDDGSVFSFNQMTTELAAVTAGEVMVSEPTPLTPHGFLRKVTAVSDVGEEVVLTTIQATLEEAIQQGELHVHHVLSPQEMQSGFWAEGVTLVRRPEQPEGEFYLQLNNVVIYDEDSDPDTDGDQIVANGSITLEIEFDFDLEVQDWHLEEMHFITTAAETAELTVTSTVEGSLLEAEITLANYPLSAITVYIGPLPVIIMPLLEVNLGADGSVQAGVTAGVTQETILTAGLQYDEEEWQLVNDFDNNFSYDPPTAMVEANMKAYTGANLDLFLYGAVGPYTKINLFLELKADPLYTPMWTLYAGLEALVGVETEVFSLAIGYSATVIDERVLLAQAETTLQLVGQIGGRSDAVAVQDDRAYVGIGPRLFILDVSNPVNPTVLGKTPVLPEVISSVAVSDNYAYVAAGQAGLRAIDISNPAFPQEVGFYNTAGLASGVTVSGNYAYVADMTVGLRIIDISNPAFPEEVGFYNTPGLAYNVAVSGNYAYVADHSDGLRVINISNPYAPWEVGYYDTNYFAYGVTVSGNKVYLTVLGELWDLRIIDVSNPATPQEVGLYDTAGGSRAVAVIGNYAYVASGSAGLRVIDISNPATPQEVGFYDTAGFAEGVVVSGNYAYVADGYDGLRVIDISNPATAQEVSFYDTSGLAEGVVVSGNYAYVADGEAGLRVIDISDPATAQEVGFYDTVGFANKVTISGNYAYIADGSAGLRIIDISNPTGPQEVGFYDTVGYAIKAVVSGNYAYVADGLSGGLRVIDISNVAAPQEVGFYRTTGSAYSVAVSGIYAYVAYSESGLRIIDISKPATPQEVGFYTEIWANDVVVSDNYAYVTGSGLRIIDISNPTTPQEVGYAAVGGNGVAISDNYAYINNGDGVVIDISNPTAPQEVGFYYTAGGGDGGVAGSGNLVYIADWTGGLVILMWNP